MVITHNWWENEPEWDGGEFYVVKQGACRRVILVHGIWHNRLWLSLLARRLRLSGYQVETFGYSTVWSDPEAVTHRLAAALSRFQVDAVVAHSLGGLITLETLRRFSVQQVRRVVCLGSPLAGSAAARTVVRWRLGCLLGRFAPLVCRGVQGWKGTAEIGHICGDKPCGLGYLLGIRAHSDGTVRCDETSIDGMAAQCFVNVSHSALLFSAHVAADVASFLRTGRFTANRSGF